MVGGFRIRTVAIEGFKGFTTRKEIDLKERHAFLLGQNGNGKSSIIEAIRWGLFGSTGRPNEIVANRDYVEACRVVITLMRKGKQWNLRRTLIRGIRGGSDAVLTDEHGQVRLIGEIMPKLDSVDAGEGAHIIFASQAAPLRSQPEDLSSFERTIFTHLGLTHPRGLLSQVDSFLVDQETIEKNLGEKLTDVRQDINSKIQHFENRRGITLRSPPWDSDHVPSVAETEIKVRDLITEITGRSPDKSLSGVSLDALIDSAENTLTSRRAQDQGGLEKELAKIVERNGRLAAFRDIQEKIETLRSEIKNIQPQLDATLSSMSLDELRNNVKETRAATDAMELRRQIVEDTISLLHRDQADSVPCPVCETMHQRRNLESVLQDTVSQLPSDTTSSLSQLEDRLKRAEYLDRESQRLRSKLAELGQRADAARTRIDADDTKEIPEHVSTDDLDQIIEFRSKQEDSIKTQIKGQKSWFDAKETRLSKLREEEKFHQLQKHLAVLQQSRNRFRQVEKAYEELVSFGESVRTVRQVIEICLKERLEKDIPGVSENLSQVFAALTRHPWYDRLTIAKERLPKLELQVASSHDPSGIGHPTGVLNGQAESALALVPYFAFSQTEDTPTEVYLVLPKTLLPRCT